MSDDQIRNHINILIQDSKKILCNFSVGVLAQSLNEASQIEEFYKIDYNKYAKKIIDDSKLPPAKKEAIRQKFLNPKEQNLQLAQTTNNSTTSSQVIEKIEHYNDLIHNPPKFKKVIKCKTCGEPIEEEPIYFSGYPYHTKCVKCMTENCTNSNDINNMICITPGLFLCQEHYCDYKESKQLSPSNYEEYHKKNKENFVNELFDNALKNTEIGDSNPEEEEEELITPDIIEDSIPIGRPYEDFIPTVTFKFSKPPEEIDFEELKKLLGEEIIIISVEKGCTIFKVAFSSIKSFFGNVKEKLQTGCQKVKTFFSTIGKPIVGNIEDEPLIKVPDDNKIQEAYSKGSLNLLQNTYKLNEIELEDIKKEVLEKVQEENSKKNWNFLFQHEDIYKKVEKQLRDDLRMNDFEMIVIAQTVIANKHIKEFDQLRSKIPLNNQKVIFIYHGTKLQNHQLIVKENFLLPTGKDEEKWLKKKLDSGYFGKGIYATDNLFYAAKYAYGYSNNFVYNEKTHVICCMAVYNTQKVQKVLDMSQSGKRIKDDIVSSCGMNQSFVGSSNAFRPIKEYDKDKNYISANEFVFPNKYQIIPVYSFTIMRKDHFILWKDENLENSENKKYMDELQERMEVNVYSSKSVDDALDIIRRKKKNKIKLITNGGQNLSGKKLIEEARKIVGNVNFVCLVFASSRQHIEWVTKMENVLFTTSPADFRKFAEMELDKNKIIEFAHHLEETYEYKININENDLLNFPLTLSSNYHY